jgi:hypothetical protein
VKKPAIQRFLTDSANFAPIYTASRVSVDDCRNDFFCRMNWFTRNQLYRADSGRTCMELRGAGTTDREIVRMRSQSGILTIRRFADRYVASHWPRVPGCRLVATSPRRYLKCFRFELPGDIVIQTRPRWHVLGLSSWTVVEVRRREALIETGVLSSRMRATKTLFRPWISNEFGECDLSGEEVTRVHFGDSAAREIACSFMLWLNSDSLSSG